MADTTEIKGVVFDLDGTLYVSERFSAEVQSRAAAYIAELKGISHAEGVIAIAANRVRLEDESGSMQTISAVCLDLGGNLQDLHRHFERTLRPEAFLARDERVIAMLDRMSERYPLYVYTNNNRELTVRILNYLGLDGVMSGIFTIDDSWRGKPDEEMLMRVLGETGLNASHALFVGDRYDIDLRLPEQLGCPVYLSRTIEKLLRLEELLD